MFHPNYVWMFFDWYLEEWWKKINGSCIIDGSVKPEDLEKLLKASLSLDHFPRIEEERKNKRNVGNIVSNICIIIPEHKLKY